MIDNVSARVRQSVAADGDPDCYHFAPPTNSYYRLIAALIPEHARTVLDIGAFLGDFSAHLVQTGIIDRAFCVDLAAEAIKYARKRHPDPRLQFAVGDIETYQPQQSYDLVFLLGLLERFTGEQAAAVLHRLRGHARYALITLTAACQTRFTTKHLLSSCRKEWRLMRRVQYDIHRRHGYDRNLRPQTDHHTFLLLESIR